MSAEPKTSASMQSRYGVIFTDSVIQDLDDEQQKWRRAYTRRSLADRLATYVIDHKPEAIRVEHPEPTQEQHRLELYVMTPAEFYLAVRVEAKRYLELTQRYPLYPSSRYESGIK